MSRPIPEPLAWADDVEVATDRRLWAAVMLTIDLHICRSILVGRPVLARSLDAEALRRALRGEALPPPNSYFRVRPSHLDAVAEAGPFQSKARTR